MPLPNSPRLQLKRNDGSDPFKRADFLENWDKIDAAPGVHICTSVSRPTWGTAHAGRKILETNTNRELIWTGTAWAEPLVSPGFWLFTGNPNQWITTNTTGVTYTMGQVIVKRACGLLLTHTVRAGAIPTHTQSMLASSRLGAVGYTMEARDIGGNNGFMQWSDTSASESVSTDHRITTFYGYAGVNPGSYNVGMNVKSNYGPGSLHCANTTTLVKVVANLGGETVA